mmetsp:Transcript_91606/g.163037  ORF Transcript_91606/g.163037 Transcript_91606/m.163037 type:complete len:215 (+) Transcript_91606:708-1352(+)
MPVAGYWIGGLGYSEDLRSRARILEAVASELPADKPRFLPLCSGTPIEVLQGVLLGTDVFELTYPAVAAGEGVALTFSWDMPADEGASEADVEAQLNCLLPATEVGSKGPPPAVRQLQLKAASCREDFGPISEASPVKQYSRAYLYHLHEVHELLGTMLLAHHNFYVYKCFFESVREHIGKGSFRNFAAWFLRTQTCELPAPLQPGPAAKRRKT